MADRWQMIGSRRTFVPPFVNERFDGPPFWACTYTALLNGANVAALGRLPATHAEVAKLAGASGDTNLRGGSRSSHMISAMRARYGVTNKRIEAVGPKEARRRLASGWALVAGVTYGELPARHRVWSPRFKLGHRVTLVGFSGMRTKILDPMASKGADYDGDWIEWDDFANAWWQSEQLWFQEGEWVKGFKADAAPPDGAAAATSSAAPPAEVDISPRVLRRFDEPRHFRVDKNAVVAAFKPAVPKPTKVRQITFDHVSGALFDAVVTFDATATIEGGKALFLRVTNGAFAGRYVPWPTAGLTADIGVAAVTTSVALGQPPAATADALLLARQAEWDRIRAEVGPNVTLPPRPTA
ncbi:MAG TPA: hypothetical protein VFV72_05770 [Candidatus Limnocylindrales bacterium]|nr:hypothetical protein [Candidatus Limnocylindrales bacterium]